MFNILFSKITANVGRLCDGLGIATGQLGTNAEQRLKVKFNRQSLNRKMSDETKVQESTNADDDSVSQPIAKPHVIGSQSQNKYSVKKYLKGIWMSLLGKVSENYTYDSDIHCD